MRQKQKFTANSKLSAVLLLEMGASYSHVFETYKDPDSVPNVTKPPTHDPLKGFPRGRKKRELIVTEEEMIAAGLTSKERDYCAPMLMALRKCRAERGVLSPLFCGHFRHGYLECQTKDQILRMKEYEREYRLMKKEQTAS
ncbi:NADH dehydrogenase (Ubiquinone) 1 beta subcomplex 7 [Echinococcus multilocularis]|uniref:NADH dehydrogenase [ubiquinone] 1 beta subcomplex subunit 7 n=1 Tax=Echinococcus multilocularis TaxID=6211 RepID=A0A087VZU4_ECHMU|nr:NADH dehydrogenase (Ubiquinone) 1 beta subcomplex 7 [Echinococcus multilocularis]